MSKEFKDQACGLDMPHGLHGIEYNKHFVRAPESLRPKRTPYEACPSHEEVMRTMR